MKNHEPSQLPAYIEIDAEQLSVLQQEALTLFIDVREHHEVPMLNPEIFKKSPMSEFANLLATDIPEKNIVFICAHGIRSAAAAEALHEKYGAEKQLYSLKGGIAKWRNYFL